MVNCCLWLIFAFDIFNMEFCTFEVVDHDDFCCNNQVNYDVVVKKDRMQGIKQARSMSTGSTKWDAVERSNSHLARRASHLTNNPLEGQFFVFGRVKDNEPTTMVVAFRTRL